MRTITLELLRHGPAHNQLLSPLTPYIALCENHGAVTVHVPFGHNQFLHRLEALGYGPDEDNRVFELKDTAAILGEILALVPGLTAEANKRELGDDPLTHLRLIISASELALLPFELAVAPAGLPGAGQQLLLQSQMPLCLTREVRRAPDDDLEWSNRKPRVLFAAAAPPDVGGIPLEAHLLALRRAIEPWVRFYNTSIDDQTHNNNKKNYDRVEEHFVFIPEATIEKIEEHCAMGTFTHVHILAHGVQVREGHDTRYALALHHPRNGEQTDRVSGVRLATALRASDRGVGKGLARPIVATLAACDAGNYGSVAGAGASIAHALHEGGISMVVAGQFPLSFEGSVRLVEVIYEGLLWGADPRHLLYDLRRRLYSQSRQTHDWASLTAYLSLPREFEQQLWNVQIEQAMGSINAAMSYADEVIRRQSARLKGERSQKKSLQQSESNVTPPQTENSDEFREDARLRMSAARKKLEELLERIPKQQGRIHGLLASTAKRQGEVLFRAGFSLESQDLLASARDHYWESFRVDRAHHWAVVQYLSLTLVIKHTDSPLAKLIKLEQEQLRPEQDPKALWTLARTLSLYDLHHVNAVTRSWSHGNLIELHLLSLLPELAGLESKEDSERSALSHTDQLVDIAGRNSFEVFSTRRQMLRYLEWYGPVTNNKLENLNSLAESIFERFPSDVEERY